MTDTDPPLARCWTATQYEGPCIAPHIEGWPRRDFDPEEFLHGFAARAGVAIGVPHAVAFGRFQLRGI